ncbi:hypothetical protein CAEBREN_09188 [Caenorhabditis brenneri]|uniref:Uncharacterized protein n=1 Tax=Caenorhabditis brenneri TaxID=135651 RepID=G0NP73_CAEBE|nr:hypothetical protein CAEBREN_09188 [Caenorhabditis brenneri]
MGPPPGIPLPPANMLQAPPGLGPPGMMSMNPPAPSFRLQVSAKRGRPAGKGAKAARGRGGGPQDVITLGDSPNGSPVVAHFNEYFKEAQPIEGEFGETFTIEQLRSKFFFNREGERKVDYLSANAFYGHFRTNTKAGAPSKENKPNGSRCRGRWRGMDSSRSSMTTEGGQDNKNKFFPFCFIFKFSISFVLPPSALPPYSIFPFPFLPYNFFCIFAIL